MLSRHHVVPEWDVPGDSPFVGRRFDLDAIAALFEDVVALEIALGRRDAEIWSARPVRVADADIRISLAQDGSPGSIRAAHLRLRRDAGSSVQRIGSTTLFLDGRSAVWRFQ